MNSTYRQKRILEQLDLDMSDKHPTCTSSEDGAEAGIPRCPIGRPSFLFAPIERPRLSGTAARKPSTSQKPCVNATLQPSLSISNLTIGASIQEHGSTNPSRRGPRASPVSLFGSAKSGAFWPARYTGQRHQSRNDIRRFSHDFLRQRAQSPTAGKASSYYSLTSHHSYLCVFQYPCRPLAIVAFAFSTSNFLQRLKCMCLNQAASRSPHF